MTSLPLPITYLITQSRVKWGSEFTASANDKIWNKTVFRHNLPRCILVIGCFHKKMVKSTASPGGLEPPTFRLTAERANRLRHGDFYCNAMNWKQRISYYRFRWYATLENKGAFYYAKDTGNFGWNSNGKVRFGFFRPEYSGPPLEVVHLFRL